MTVGKGPLLDMLIPQDEIFGGLRRITAPPQLLSPDSQLSPVLLEAAYWLVVVLVAGFLLWWRPGFLARAEAVFNRIACRRRLAVLVVFLAALTFRLGLLPVLPPPEPAIKDEFSYLLGADTFASGRLTNPTPPMWVHFESYYINMVPSYQTMYPPAQSLFLAAGQKLTGHPWAGVVLSVALMCAAICWALQAWVPFHWAFLGGLFLVLRFCGFSYWMNSYWGGAVPALGGALVWGSLPRFRKRPQILAAILFVAGLAIVANSRPFEGLLVSLPAGLLALVWAIRHRKNKQANRKVVAPALVLLALTFAWMGYYNWRGTGNPLNMPYLENSQRYHITRLFLWQDIRPIPNYNHAAMRAEYCFWELPPYYLSRTLDGFFETSKNKLLCYYSFLVWPLLILLVPGLWLMFQHRRTRAPALTLLLLLAGLAVQTFHPMPHYAAPGLVLSMLALLAGLRWLRVIHVRGRRIGRPLLRAAVIVVLVFLLGRIGYQALDPYGILQRRVQAAELERARVLHQLERIPGRHLVFVNQKPATRSFNWIANPADLDHAKVLFAWDMGREANAELLRHYHRRETWLVNRDDGLAHLRPYGGINDAMIESNVTGCNW